MKQKMKSGLILISSIFLLQGCITTDESYEQTRDPFYAQDTEQELKTEEDWARWQKQQQHNNNAHIFVPGTK